MTTEQLQSIINHAWENRANINPSTGDVEVRDAVNHAIADLNAGRRRVAEKIDGNWVTHQWLKKAVLLSFRLSDNASIKAGELGFYDKVQTKFAHLDDAEMRATGVRVVPQAVGALRTFSSRYMVAEPSHASLCADAELGGK